jgi:hypothetical protein
VAAGFARRVALAALRGAAFDRVERLGAAFFSLAAFFAEGFFTLGRLTERPADDAFRVGRADRAARLAFRLAIHKSFRTLTVWR